ncbi:MAG: PEP-CTERM sorting domain-containing protein [Pirellulales bacterium]|nr:PEP-CTERM sorting domain-containing protein [Pirellulales bacterium]
MRANALMGLTAAVLVIVACGGTAQAEYVSTLTGMSGLVSYWNLNETSGATAADSIAGDALDGDNPGTYSGTGVTLGAAGPRPSDGFLGFSPTNNSASFADDQNTKLQMAEHLAYAGAKDLSLVTWVRFPSVPTSSSDRRTVGGLQRDTDSSRYIFATALYNPTPAGLQGFMRRGDGSGADFTRYLGDVDAWHMWVLTLEDGQTAKCYLDGDLKETYTFADNTYGLDTATGLVFGADIRVSANRPWKGELDEIAMFSRAISDTEVAALYRAAVVPEPGTLALVVLGTLCLAALGRRRA